MSVFDVNKKRSYKKNISEHRVDEFEFKSKNYSCFFKPDNYGFFCGNFLEKLTKKVLTEQFSHYPNSYIFYSILFKFSLIIFQLISISPCSCKS